MAKKGVSYTIFGLVITIMTCVCVAVGLLVFYLACPEKAGNHLPPAPNNNSCGSEIKNQFVKIIVNDRSITNRPIEFESQSPYVPQITVSLAMRNLAATTKNSTNVSTKFVYTTNSYVPYGDMVTSINGQWPGKNQYWKMTVNNLPATCGIDTYILNNGDVIRWSLETVQKQ